MWVETWKHFLGCHQYDEEMPLEQTANSRKSDAQEKVALSKSFVEEKKTWMRAGISVVSNHSTARI